jgi:photosystem II stability/assembly factor-like uncharacterized protein
MGSAIKRSVDRGQTWTQVATLPTSPAHSFYVHPTDSNLMLASTGSGAGAVQRSTNYGLTWLQTFAGQLTSYGMPLEMNQNSPNTCYLAPDNSQFKRSTDFGLTWVNIGGPPITYNGGLFRSPCDLVVSYENSNILYLGDGTTGAGSGELFKSTNGGANWFSIHTVSGSEIPMLAISSLDLNLTYHTCWSSGGVWKSNNQWTTFSQVATTGSAWAIDIAKDDPTAVAYGVYGSSVYVSTNSGTSFAVSSVGSSPEAGMLFYDKGTLFSQKGGGVYRLNITYTVPTVSGNGQISSEIPKEFALSQNYPNPFNPRTVISYQLPLNSFVSIKVFDVLGREVESLVNEELQAGIYEADWSGIKNPSGIYFYTLLVNGERIDTKKMVLVK